MSQRRLSRMWAWSLLGCCLAELSCGAGYWHFVAEQGQAKGFDRVAVQAAVADMRCPPARVRLEPHRDSWQARGCGQTAFYQCWQTGHSWPGHTTCCAL